jgi:anti-sigma regulatory factor (Ser/Thr protein kinase)
LARHPLGKVAAVKATTRLHDSVSVTLHPHPQAVATARRFVVSVLASHLDEARLNDVEVIVSEVVTNGVMHAATTMELVVELRDDVAHVELVDSAPGEPLIRPETGADGGFGLRIVSAMARRWGVRHEDDSKAVWFEI